jgi:hypothetical protein
MTKPDFLGSLIGCEKTASVLLRSTWRLTVNEGVPNDADPATLSVVRTGTKVL